MRRLGWATVAWVVVGIVGVWLLLGRRGAAAGGTVAAPVVAPPTRATGGAPYQVGASGYQGTQNAIVALSGAITGIAGALSSIGSQPTPQPWTGTISDGYIPGFPDTGNSLVNILNPGLDYSQAGTLGN